MPHSHHHGCKHDLKYCEVCDVVYCTKCGKEWGKTVFYYSYSSPYVYPLPNTNPYPLTYTATAHSCEGMVGG